MRGTSTSSFSQNENIHKHHGQVSTPKIINNQNNSQEIMKSTPEKTLNFSPRPIQIISETRSQSRVTQRSISETLDPKNLMFVTQPHQNKKFTEADQWRVSGVRTIQTLDRKNQWVPTQTESPRHPNTDRGYGSSDRIQIDGKVRRSLSKDKLKGSYTTERNQPSHVEINMPSLPSNIQGESLEQY